MKSCLHFMDSVYGHAHILHWIRLVYPFCDKALRRRELTWARVEVFVFCFFSQVDWIQCLVSVVMRHACPSQHTPFLVRPYTTPSVSGCPALTGWIASTLPDCWLRVSLHWTITLCGCLRCLIHLHLIIYWILLQNIRLEHATVCH